MSLPYEYHGRWSHDCDEYDYFENAYFVVHVPCRRWLRAGIYRSGLLAFRQGCPPFPLAYFLASNCKFRKPATSISTALLLCLSSSPLYCLIDLSLQMSSSTGLEDDVLSQLIVDLLPATVALLIPGLLLYASLYAFSRRWIWTSRLLSIMTLAGLWMSERVAPVRCAALRALFNFMGMLRGLLSVCISELDVVFIRFYFHILFMLGQYTIKFFFLACPICQYP
jgi:hypothetical protein